MHCAFDLLKVLHCILVATIPGLGQMSLCLLQGQFRLIHFVM